MSTVTPPSSFGVTSMLPPSPGVTEAVVSPGVAVVVELEDAPPVTLPEDCWQICSGGVFRLGADGNVERTNGFRLLGEDRLAVAGAADGAWMLEYFRYPVLLREKPEDGDLVDCPPECAGAVACYAAAQLAALDDANLQAALYNEFENRLSRLGELPVANREEIGNMYGGWEAVE